MLVIIGTALADPEQPLDLAPVEADNHLAINHCHRGRPQSKLEQFLQGLLIVSDILRGKFHTLLRKKLFLGIAGASSRRGIDDHLFRHDLLLRGNHPGFDADRVKSEPKISRPASKASTIVIGRPSGRSLACHQAFRSSVEQKKLMSGHRDCATGQQTSSASGNQTTLSRGRY